MPNDDWQTPPALFAQLHDAHRFTLDAAATRASALVRHRARRGRRHPAGLPWRKGYLTPRDDALACPWGERERPSRVFVNPPYSKSEAHGSRSHIELFVAKAARELGEGRAVVVVMILQADPSTRAFHWLLGGRERPFLPSPTFVLNGTDVGYLVHRQSIAVRVAYTDRRIAFYEDGAPVHGNRAGSAIVTLTAKPWRDGAALSVGTYELPAAEDPA